MKIGASRTVLFGAAAGILATAVMDIFVAGAMLLMGNPVLLMFAFIGDVAAAFFARLGLAAVGGVPLGIFMHYMFGLGYGALFCAACSRIKSLKTAGLGKRILLGITYIEVFSQPFLASAPLVLPMSRSDILGWYALSTVMHAVYGAVLGALEHRRSAALAAPRAAA